jgi:nucleotide-binding universal stress UspA family protein
VPGPTGQQLLTGEAVLEHANALGCDLLIKGAYTQSRLRQFILGGTTRYILRMQHYRYLAH